MRESVGNLRDQLQEQARGRCIFGDIEIDSIDLGRWLGLEGEATSVNGPPIRAFEKAKLSEAMSNIAERRDADDPAAHEAPAAQNPPPSTDHRRARKRDTEADAKRRIALQQVQTAARKEWPAEPRPSPYAMAQKLVLGKPGKKLHGLGEVTIKKFLSGKYEPAIRLGIDAWKA
jgi:hypothetical protein